LVNLNVEGRVSSVQWQLGVWGTVWGFAGRQIDSKKTVTDSKQHELST